MHLLLPVAKENITEFNVLDVITKLHARATVNLNSNCLTSLLQTVYGQMRGALLLPGVESRRTRHQIIQSIIAAAHIELDNDRSVL